MKQEARSNRSGSSESSEKTSESGLLKICFVLSSIGGPRMLSPLFAAPLKDDVAYIVIQRLASPGMLDVLVECLREEVNCPTFTAGHNLQLQGGAIHFLPNDRNYSFRGNRLIEAELPGTSKLNLDHLFGSAAQILNPCSVVVVSGMLIDEDGLAGLTKLHERGIEIIGTLESHTPVFDLIEQLKQKKLMDHLYPPKNLFEHLTFNESSNGKITRRDGLDKAPKILVADDEELVRRTLMDMLRMQGMTVDAAADGLDALRQIQKIKYDALLLDLHMPEMDGLRTLEALKTIDPTLPIIVMTASEDKVKIEAAKEFQILGVIKKPLSWDKLKKLLLPLHQKIAE